MRLAWCGCQSLAVLATGELKSRVLMQMQAGLAKIGCFSEGKWVGGDLGVDTAGIIADRMR
jgi:hypothetical protein